MKILLLLSIQTLALNSHASQDNLTHEVAKMRKSQVESVDYKLHFTLNKDSEEFSAKALLYFTLNKTDKPLKIDFVWKKILSLKVNGVPLTNFSDVPGTLEILAKNLKKTNEIEIDYTGSFSKEGAGFQRAIDPEDKSEYIYTDFEPAYAHELFPCFDQPNLKATFSTSVDIPKEWKAISNELIAGSSTKGDRSEVQFAKTSKLSTYLFFLGVGPFVEWKAIWHSKDKEVPLFIYTRQTLAKYVDADKLFETSKKGLSFYSDYFGYSYPFSKYGMVFIPEFAWGGMENPGAIALNERNIFRGPVSRSKMEGRDSLLLHEMAHMWFGDLVTMQWWNDLWLNESFATYVSTLCQSRAMGALGTALDFFSTKTWGYWQDQLITTHPIETDVKDVRSAKGNFDGITYAKGASALKQLHFFVGEEGFREGLRSYFKKYAFKNTLRKNFIDEIALASKMDLKKWTHDWLQTAGPNRVETLWGCKNEKLVSFTIRQKPSVSKTLSPHRTEIGLFKSNLNGELSLYKTLETFYSGADTPLKKLRGEPCPEFVYANMQDQDYALFLLDPISLKHAKRVIGDMKQPPLLRLMLWNTLYRMVREALLSPLEYFDSVLTGLEKESDDALLGVLLGRHSSIKETYFTYLNPSERKNLAPKLEAVIWKHFEQSEQKSSKQMIYFDFYVAIAQSQDALSKLATLLNSKESPNGMVIDQDRRWSLLITLAEENYPEVLSLVAAEEKMDPSTAGKRSAYTAKASVPNLSNKNKYWEEFQKPESIPYSFLRSGSREFHHPNHPELSQPFAANFFKQVKALDWSKHDNLAEIYFENLFPAALCSKELLNQSQKEFKLTKNLTSLVQRHWLEANDELERCVKVRR